MPADNLMGVIDIIAVRESAQAHSDFVAEEIAVRIERHIPIEIAAGEQTVQRDKFAGDRPVQEPRRQDRPSDQTQQQSV